MEVTTFVWKVQGSTLGDLQFCLFFLLLRNTFEGDRGKTWNVHTLQTRIQFILICCRGRRISCEENGSDGFVWQTDPSGKLNAERTSVVPEGGNYESFAYDDRGGHPVFFTTEDTDQGPVVRFVPDSLAMQCYNAAAPEDRWCTLNSGTYSFLNLSRDECQSGMFSWDSQNTGQGRSYPFAEGIDCRGRFHFPIRF